MADQGGKQVFGLDLDTVEFVKKALDAKKGIEDIGAEENLAGLMRGLLAASTAIAAVGVAAFALKTTFDVVFEGEQIRKTSALFESLANNFGIAGDKLKEDLIRAGGGLADTTDIINGANRAMLSLGKNAEKLPQVMDLARKLTVNFGGDMTERFNQLSYAIATGSERMLRSNGIFIDADKAIKDYARSLGVSSGALTEAGRQQAILNAVIGFSNKNVKELDGANKSALTTWQQLKVTLKDIGEAFTLAFEKIAGPIVRAVLEDMSKLARITRDTLVGAFGEGSEQAEAKLSKLRTQVAGLNKELENLEKQAAGAEKGGLLQAIFGGPDFDKRIEATKEKIAAMNSEIAALEKEHSEEKLKLADKEKEQSEAVVNDELVDRKKAAQEKMRLEQEVLQMKEENNRRTLEMTTDTATFEQALAEQKTLEDQEYLLRKQALDLEMREKGLEDTTIHHQMLEELEVAHEQRMVEIERQATDERIRLLERQQNAAQSTAQGIGRAFETNAAKANKALKNFGATGQMVANTIQHRGSEAFMAFGKAAVDHSQSASQIMKGFFLNALADMAQAQGMLYMAAGLVNPGMLVAGAALLVLAGVLRGMAGMVGGGGGGGGGAEFGGSGGGSYAASSAFAGDSEQPKEEKKKSVTLNLYGDYLNTDETKRTLLQAVRDATDATDFTYNQIGRRGI